MKKFKNILFIFVFLISNITITSNLLLSSNIESLKKTKEYIDTNKKTYLIDTTMVKEYSVNKGSLISIKNANGPLSIETWDKDIIKIETTVVIESDIESIKGVFRNIEKILFKSDKEKIYIDTKKIYKPHSNLFQKVLSFFYDKLEKNENDNKIFYLNNNSKVNLKKLSYVITLPKNNPLSIENSYYDVLLPDLSEYLSLHLFDANLKAGKIKNNAKIKIQYGSGNICSVENIKLSLFEANLIIGRTNDLTVYSKYSKLDVQETRNTIIKSYSDTIIIRKSSNIEGKAQYSNFILNDFLNGNFNFFSCDFKIDSAVNILAKSKYSYFLIFNLKNSINFLSSFSDEINIGMVCKNFKEIDVKSQYSNLNASFEESSKYKISTNLHYCIFNYHNNSITHANNCSVIKLKMSSGNINLN